MVAALHSRFKGLLRWEVRDSSEEVTMRKRREIFEVEVRK
jgi:hypothetical protein